jgi:hypothetical protein
VLITAKKIICVFPLLEIIGSVGGQCIVFVRIFVLRFVRSGMLTLFSYPLKLAK